MLFVTKREALLQEEIRLLSRENAALQARCSEQAKLLERYEKHSEDTERRRRELERQWNNLFCYDGRAQEGGESHEAGH